MVKMGNMPASVLVDMALIESAPDKKFPNLVITGPKTTNCNTHGIPDKEEINTLEEILNATGNFLTGVTPKVLVGTVTRNCQRLNYYYVKDTAGIRNALNRMYTRSYKNYSWVISIKSDPEWTSYRTFLYPDEDTRTWMENDKIIARMLQQGDSLTQQRDINFEIYFRSDTDREAFTTFAKSKGYTTIPGNAPETPNAPFKLAVRTFNFIKMDIINPMSKELKIEARKHHGIYNQWQAVVAKTERIGN